MWPHPFPFFQNQFPVTPTSNQSTTPNKYFWHFPIFIFIIEFRGCRISSISTSSATLAIFPKGLSLILSLSVKVMLSESIPFDWCWQLISHLIALGHFTIQISVSAKLLNWSIHNSFGFQTFVFSFGHFGLWEVVCFFLGFFACSTALNVSLSTELNRISSQTVKMKQG